MRWEEGKEGAGCEDVTPLDHANCCPLWKQLLGVPESDRTQTKITLNFPEFPEGSLILSSYAHIFPAIHDIVVTCVKGSVLHVFGLFRNRELKQKK